MPLEDELVASLVPFVDRVAYQFVRLRLETDDLDELLDPPDHVHADPGMGLYDDVPESSQ